MPTSDDTSAPLPLVGVYSVRARARRVLAAFLLTFTLSRVVVLLIMTRRLPDFYMHVAGTHVHHLNYGIFLLCFIAGWSLFIPPTGRGLELALSAYGISLALTFDEFGMWLHLGGSYWQRASFDAIVVVTALLLLIMFMPSLRCYQARHWSILAAVLFASALLTLLLIERLNRFGASMGPWLKQIELNAPQ